MTKTFNTCEAVPPLESGPTYANQRFVCQRSISETLGILIFFGIGYLFFGIALFNLFYIRPFDPQAHISASIWIGVVVFATISNCRNIGFHQHCINFLAAFVRNRFISIEWSDPTDKIIALGFTFASHSFYQLKFKSKAIQTVDWRMGQASDRTKKECNDWSIAIWFDVTSITYNNPEYKQGICIIGSSDSKETIATCGTELIKFLRSNNINLPSPKRDYCELPATAIEDISPSGKIKVAGEIFIGRSVDGYIHKGQSLHVTDVVGTSIYVKKSLPPKAPPL